MRDQLVTGRAFRILTFIAQWSRESVLMEANVAVTGQSVVDALEELSAHRPRRKPSPWIPGPNSRPKRWTNGPTDRGVLDFIRPGKPVENATGGERVYRKL